MTREEAIIEEAIKALKLINLDRIHPFLGWEEIMEVRDVAIAALRAQQDAQRSDPLTLEELREMDGQKIFVRYTDGFYTDEDGAYFGKFEQLVRECEGRLTACELPLKYYGKTWLAYRSKS